MRTAVVGAGTAGSYLAWRLADPQHQVLLFDPRVPGYEKPCGGGLSPLVGRRFPDVMTLPFPRYRPPCVQLRMSDGATACNYRLGHRLPGRLGGHCWSALQATVMSSMCGSA